MNNTDTAVEMPQDITGKTNLDSSESTDARRVSIDVKPAWTVEELSDEELLWLGRS